MLHRMGVPYFQGYLFAKPRPAEEITAWLKTNGLRSEDVNRLEGPLAIGAGAG